MRPEDYPAQDELAEFAQGYAAEVMQRAAGIEAEDVLFGDDVYQRVGIHKPLHSNGAVFAFIHGGGWTNGYKEWNDFMAPAFTGRGVTFVTIGYRMAPMHIFPAGYDDCAAGLAWIYKNIADYCGDPQRLYLGGHSAGGHYASLLAIKKDWQSDLGIPQGIIRGCVPVSGVYRFGDGSGLTQRPRFLGEEGNSNAAAASPVLHINGATCPFLIAHGDKDFPHLITQAEEMAQALKKSGASAERVVLPDSDHFGAHYLTGESNGKWTERILKFMAV
ncbi:MAG TPA: alpha/beta hydrolase [Rhodospirillales bacterium]|nr:alpha/beta hydrolase [Rhodospirillales bacterium]